jgi:hypothetical protein
VTEARWLKREGLKQRSDLQTNSIRSKGAIGCRAAMSLGSAKMAMELHRLVIGKCEMSAEAHGIGATEGNLWSIW